MVAFVYTIGKRITMVMQRREDLSSNGHWSDHWGVMTWKVSFRISLSSTVNAYKLVGGCVLDVGRST
jgi:hypothetical protein